MRVAAPVALYDGREGRRPQSLPEMVLENQTLSSRYSEYLHRQSERRVKTRQHRVERRCGQGGICESLSLSLFPSLSYRLCSVPVVRCMYVTKHRSNGVGTGSMHRDPHPTLLYTTVEK